MAPTASLGTQIRGSFPAGSTRFNYGLYVANGPRLNLGTADPGDAGKLEFDNYSDVNRDKAFGGRVGFLPIPELELGYSLLSASVEPKGSGLGDVGALIRGVDLSYSSESDLLRGLFAAYGEWVWSDVDDVDYGAGLFHNSRKGGYLQLSYRPSLLPSDVLSRLEGVVRYDLLEMPRGAPVFDQRRWTFGLNYQLVAGTGVKLAYQRTFDDLPAEGRWSDSWLMQGYVGF